MENDKLIERMERIKDDTLEIGMGDASSDELLCEAMNIRNRTLLAVEDIISELKQREEVDEEACIKVLHEEISMGHGIPFEKLDFAAKGQLLKILKAILPIIRGERA